MSAMDQDQISMERSIRKGAMIWGVVCFVIIGLLAYWLLGSYGDFARIAGGAVLGATAGFSVFKWSFGQRAKDALCEKCGAGFSISRTQHDEVLNSSGEKSSREPQDDGSTEVSEWIEDVFDVTDVLTCAKCQNATVKNYQSTRRRDVKTHVEPARGLARVERETGRDDTSVESSVPQSKPAPPTNTAGRAGRSRD